jgi:hypothetical protein
VYESVKQPSLFDPEHLKKEKRLTTDGLRQFAARRLQTIFPYVCEQQLDLKNSKGSTLFHLFIMCANDSALAVRLAEK